MSKNWREWGGVKDNFLTSAFIGKTLFIPAFELTLDLFRITGHENERFLSAAPEAA